MLRFVSKCEMWSRNATSDFSFAEIFLWIRSRDHAWSFHRLCSTVWLEFFRDDECFDENDSSNMTKAIHQIWHDDISSFLISNISSNLTKCISSNLIKLVIKFDNCVSSNSDERYLIKLDEDSSNLTIFHQTRRKLCLFSLINVF